jgi:DNA-binding response OmpR family regulator
MQAPEFSNKKRILHVDGYEDNRLLLAYLLEDLGYSCVAASTVEAGVAIASSKTFDLYILDSWYSDGKGVDLCRRIRRFDRTGPIIFFSAWPLESARQEAIVAGASGYLLKPALDEVLFLAKILLTDHKPLSDKSIVATDLIRSMKTRVSANSVCGDIVANPNL